MKITIATLALIVLMAATPASELLSLGISVGKIALPPHYTYARTGTIDSDMGTITGPQGFVVNFDVGYMAGTHMAESRRKECEWFLEHTVGGRRALTGVVRKDGKRVLITTIWSQTPRDVPANFWTTVRTEKDVAMFMAIVTTYK
jgi:hypothetical protein